MTTESQPVEVYRKGTSPIFKYVVRKPREWYMCVMLDDEAGDITISGDMDIEMSHWWPHPDRGDKLLREFLVRASLGYLEDKFSYHHSRHNPQIGLKQMREDLAEELKAGRIEQETMDNFEEFVVSSLEDTRTYNEFDLILQSEYMQDEASEVVEVLECLYADRGERPTTSDYSSPKVSHVIRNYGPYLVEFIKKELAEEKAVKGQHESQVSN